LNTPGSSEGGYFRKNSLSANSAGLQFEKRISKDASQPSPLESLSANKLSQFFGENSVPNSARLSDVNYWFLQL
jgi:hypothetical protein